MSRRRRTVRRPAAGGRPAPHGPVRRRSAVVGLLVGAALLAGIVGLAETLRPSGTAAPGAEAPEADPREPFACPEPRAVAGEPVRVTSNLLYACPDRYDGLTVVYEGEAVGAMLERRAGVWLQLNDDAYAAELGPLPAHQDFRGGNAGVGVLVPAAFADAVTFVGGPTAHGDLVEVTGVFHRVDEASREVAVIRAASARVVAPGEPLERPDPLDRRVAAYVAMGLALALTLAERAAARRAD